jgi:hypothetical protein
MAKGKAKTQVQFEDAAHLLGERLAQGSIYRLLAEQGHRMFEDDYFADLFKDSRRGRPTIPARTIATVMLLQSFEGLSDQEAVDRLAFDLRWQAAAGLSAAAASFHPTVLVGMRNRLRASARPRRLFEDTVEIAKATGVVSRRVRVFDSTPLLDAVATQDTVTQLRAAIRKVLATAPSPIASKIRSVLRRDDDYLAPGKPPCDWDDHAAREELVDSLVKDAVAALDAIADHTLADEAARAAELLAVVSGQDVEQKEDGTFGIVRGVARDRVISTVDPQARHGHKSRARSFDGYKAHLAIDPDSEIITAVATTPANTQDREAIDELIDEEQQRPLIVGDSAYADGATLARMAASDREIMTKVPAVRNAKGYSKDLFVIDLVASTVTCPAANTTAIIASRSGSRASFAGFCGACPLRSACTTSRRGRVVSIHPYEGALQHAKMRQKDPVWQQTYRSTRPIVERKIAHFTRRAWGGRRARCRGLKRIATDVDTRAGVLNLARLAVLRLRWEPIGWATG